ncbi:MAG TPA: vWA domain-containing protein, partial [Clostridia bacterium]|nr:vWA domain-containing protein [Clostridia bacterium]
MKRFAKTGLAGLLSAAIILTMAVPVSATSPKALLGDPLDSMLTLNNASVTTTSPDATTLRKEVKKVSGNSKQFDVTLTLTAPTQGKTQSTDIVLVMDTSGSMGYSNGSGGTRLSDAKSAAKKFVDTVLKSSYPKNQVALVSFGNSVTTFTDSSTHSNFVNYNNAGDIQNAIGQLHANQGTFMQGGIKAAESLLSGSSADNKYIILLSDGYPNYSLGATQGVQSPQTWNGWSGWRQAKNSSSYTPENYILTAFGTTLKGTGNPYSGYQLNGSGANTKPYSVSGVTGKVNNNGVATISEAYAAQHSGITMYSIGCNISGNAQADYVLTNCASTNDHYYSVASTNLNDVYQTIAGQIVWPSVVVKDAIGADFSYVGLTDAINPNPSSGNAAEDPSSKVVTWRVSSLQGTQKLVYRVQINSDVTDGSHSIDVSNTSVPTGLTVDSGTAYDFPSQPYVDVGTGSVTIIPYLSDSSGAPIDTSGNPVATKSDAALSYGSYTPSNPQVLTSLKLQNNYNVPGIAGYISPDSNVYTLNAAQQFKLTLDQPTQTVYVPYTMDKTIHIKYMELKSDGTTAALDVSSTGNPTSIHGAIGSTYDISSQLKPVNGYGLVTAQSDPLSGKFKCDSSDITLLYSKQSYDYFVQYYKDGAKFGGQVKLGSAEFQSSVKADQLTNLYGNKPVGYKVGDVQNLPLTISNDLSKNVINVYYTKDSYDYYVQYYKDGAKFGGQVKLGSAEFQSSVKAD